MAIAGDRLPDVQVMTMAPDGPQHVRTHELLGEGRVVLFAVPGAFTPVCSDHHLPGFVFRVPDLKSKGVDLIACLSVNDPFVMAAWGDVHAVGNEILMIGDPEALFTAAMGMEVDASEFGLGDRSQRYAAIVEDGTIIRLAVEDHFAEHLVSGADAVLSHL